MRSPRIELNRRPSRHAFTRGLTLCGMVVPLLSGGILGSSCAPQAQLPTPEVRIDATLKPVRAAREGINHGPPRPVGALIGPDGARVEFIENEIILHVQSQKDLDAFIAKYGATVLRDGTPLEMPGADPVDAPDSSGYYLLRIDPSKSFLSDLGDDLATLQFSSEEAAHTFAVATREKSGGAEINPLLEDDASIEHPDDFGGNIDAEKFSWFTEDDAPSIPGDQGLSTGVIHAWDYLAYHGILEHDGIFFVPKIAIVDHGFDLDDTTGLPLHNNRDFNPPGVPLQVDLVDNDSTAGGINIDGCDGFCPWHGQGAFGIAAAMPNNGFGSAGVGGHFVRPMLLRTGHDAYTRGQAIRTAAHNGASVISNSYSSHTKTDAITDAIKYARGLGAIVLGSAGNGDKDPKTGAIVLQDLGKTDLFPCENEGVICVGAVMANKNNAFNFGSGVDIWAPTNMLSTPDPDSIVIDANNTGTNELPSFGGTSAATPFVAGLIGLMKSAQPNITEAEVLSILQSTANSSPDPLVAKGYVDAFRAVRGLIVNMPPIVTLIQPVQDQVIGWQAKPFFKCTYVDPEVDPTDVTRTNRFHGVVVFSSEVDGELCRSDTPPYNCTSTKSELTIGRQVITVRATDPFEGTSIIGIKVNVVNRPPEPSIVKPVSTDTFFTHIPVKFEAFVPDPDETITDAQISWSSNLDGTLGTGIELQKNLTAGSHTITLTATDGKGLTATKQVVITVVAGAGFPTPVITSPLNGDLFGPGQQVTLQGSATDPENGTLTGMSLEWSSDRDGVLGNGNSVTFTPSFVPSSTPGCAGGAQHIITLKATDSDNHVITTKITLNIGCIF